MENAGYIMRWPELDREVHVAPIEHNRELFDWFLSNLPTRCVQTVTVVAGLSLYMQNIPMKQHACNWIQENAKLERIDKYNTGRMMFFMTAGHTANICCAADWITEPLYYPTWCEVIDEDKPIVREVAWTIWNSLLQDKKTYHVEFLPWEGPVND